MLTVCHQTRFPGLPLDSSLTVKRLAARFVMMFAELTHVGL